MYPLCNLNIKNKPSENNAAKDSTERSITAVYYDSMLL